VTTLGNRYLWAEIDILDGMEELGSLFHRTLESLATGNHSRATGAFVDNGCLDGIFEVVGSRGTARVDEAGPSHVAVDNLVTAEVDRMVGGELGVDPLIELAVAGIAGVESLISAIVLRKLLFDNVRFDSDSEVVGLTGEIG